MAIPAKPEQASTITIAAVGDVHINNAITNAQSRLVSAAVQALNPEVVLALGDFGQPVTTVAVMEEYDEIWGWAKPIIWPTRGNHDALTGADGYDAYFAPRNLDKLEFILGSWYIVSVSTEGNVKTEASWLNQRLAYYKNFNTILYLHKPYHASQAFAKKTGAAGKPFYDVAYKNGVDLILTGHSHTYERFGAQRPDGTKDTAKGYRQIIVGTGGGDHSAINTPLAKNSLVRDNKHYGYLKLDLRRTGWTSKYVRTSGGDLDAVSAGVH